MNATILAIAEELGIPKGEIRSPRMTWANVNDLSMGERWARAFKAFAEWAGLPWGRAIGLVSSNGALFGHRVREAFFEAHSGGMVHEGVRYPGYVLRQAVGMVIGNAIHTGAMDRTDPAAGRRVVLNGLPDELVRQAKATATLRGQTLAAFTEAALTAAVENTTGGKRAGRGKRTGSEPAADEPA